MFNELKYSLLAIGYTTPHPHPSPRVTGLLAHDKTSGRVTGTGYDRWQVTGYCYRKRQVIVLQVTGTGKDRRQGYWLLVQDKTGGRVTGY